MIQDADTTREHNCEEYKVWRNTKDYNLIECALCKNISHFAFKSFWKRIKFVFWNRVNTDY
jgi:hypothetical protein